ncbi:alpha-L-rhamnosidase C-terminal domain-containing protein [Kiritimatiellaeota bacterium B1221]|nr:alpha-L-rhamnosidase C-terminal domain-containing protein [Kiritimatiellaeota bacterium B1221]
MNTKRVLLPAHGHLSDANARHSHPAEKGSWIWHPDRRSTETAVVRFTRKFRMESAAQIQLHVTADQRFQLRCDGVDLSYGPDRCDPQHWTVQTIELELDAGDHCLEALVWWIAEQESFAPRTDGGKVEVPGPPMAQMTWRPGFLLYSEDVPAELINTGEAAWMAADLTDAVDLFKMRIPHYIDVGPSFGFDMAAWQSIEAVPAQTTIGPVVENPHGVRRPGWCLFPAMLPEQHRQFRSGGCIRAVRESWDESAFTEAETQNLESWQGLCEGEGLTIEAGKELTLIWDLAEYSCGYAGLEVAGGTGATIEFDWAEALYEAPTADDVDHTTFKGHRSNVIDKSFLGYGDRWELNGSDGLLPALWWRAGRFVRVRISTGREALVLKGLGFLQTGYPLECAAEWQSSDKDWDGLIPMFDNSFKCSAHETWTDSPYYEQLSYVGDDRLHMLSNYAGYADDRVSRYAILNFAWSAAPSGLVAERYPSAWRQESLTYSMLWPIILKDFMMWRDDMAFVKAQLPHLRTIMANTEALPHDGDLMTARNGWPFIDWVKEWKEGCGPGVREGDSSLVNLHWVLSLQAAAAVEATCGDEGYAHRWEKKAQAVMAAILERYWDAERKLLLDTTGEHLISEHAQYYALITGLLSRDQARGCLAALQSELPMAEGSIYSTFYLLDALYQLGEEDAFHRRLDFWRGLLPQGFTATPEAPEPSRSDAHAWGSHPFFHSFASIAGIRPSAPGYAKVKIAPLPGEMTHIHCRSLHPQGMIQVKMDFTEAAVVADVELPGSLTGEFVWKGQTLTLSAGENHVRLS